MSDQLSKVVPPVHAVTFVPSFSEAARCLGMAQAQGKRLAIEHWQGIVDAHETAAKAALRIESAAYLPNPGEIGSKSVDAAPVEVELPELPDPDVKGIHVDGYSAAQMEAYARSHAATLARQLAEAKAELRNEREQVSHWRMQAMNTESKLAAATRRVAEVEGVLREALRGWDDVIEDIELNGMHDDPRFNYRRQKEWLSNVEAKAGATLKEPK